MALLLDAACGAANTPKMQEWMRTSWESIAADPSFIHYLPTEFAEPIHGWVDDIVTHGGKPLRALWITTAILYPQIWRVVCADTPPYAVLRQQMVAFIFGKRGFRTPADYLLAVTCAFRTYQRWDLPRAPSIGFTPKPPLREFASAGPVDPALEQATKTKHHSQLHLRTGCEGDAEKQLQVTQEVGETMRHLEFTNMLIALVTKCWCYMFVEAHAP